MIPSAAEPSIFINPKFSLVSSDELTSGQLKIKPLETFIEDSVTKSIFEIDKGLSEILILKFSLSDKPDASVTTKSNEYSPICSGIPKSLF